MEAETITELAEWAVDVAAIDGDDTTISSLTMGEMADGSRRSYALIETSDGSLDQTYRLCSPAP